MPSRFRKYYLYVLIALCGYPCPASAQDAPPDEAAAKTQFEEALRIQWQEPAKAFDLVESALEVLPPGTTRRRACYTSGDLAMGFNRWALTVARFESFIRDSGPDGPPDSLFKAHYLLSTATLNLMQFEDAMRHIQAAETLARALPDSIQPYMPWLWMSKGRVYAEAGPTTYPDAEAAFRTADSLSRGVEDDWAIGNSLMGLGNVFYYAEQYDSAGAAFLRAIPYFQSVGDSGSWHSCLVNLVRVELNRDRLDAARDRLEMAMRIQDDLHDPMLEISGLLTEAEVFLAARSPADAEPGLRRVMVLSDSLDYPYDKLGAIEFLVEVKEMQGNYKEALELHRRHTELSDSLMGEDMKRRVAEMKVINEMERKDRDLALEKAANAELRLSEQTARTRYVILALALIIVLAGGGLYLRTLRLRKRNAEIEKQLAEQELLEAEKERERIQRDLAYKTQTLSSWSLLLTQKNELLADLKEKVEKLSPREGGDPEAYHALKRVIESGEAFEHEWSRFTELFEQVHPDFLPGLSRTFSKLTSNDLRMCALLKMNYSTKQIAAVLNISPKSVEQSRYRLRGKLELQQGEDLVVFLNSLSFDN